MCNFSQFQKLLMIIPKQRGPGPVPKRDMTKFHIYFTWYAYKKWALLVNMKIPFPQYTGTFKIKKKILKGQYMTEFCFCINFICFVYVPWLNFIHILDSTISFTNLNIFLPARLPHTFCSTSGSSPSLKARIIWSSYSSAIFSH